MTRAFTLPLSALARSIDFTRRPKRLSCRLELTGTQTCLGVRSLSRVPRPQRPCALSDAKGSDLNAHLGLECQLAEDEASSRKDDINKLAHACKAAHASSCEFLGAATDPNRLTWGSSAGPIAAAPGCA